MYGKVCEWRAAKKFEFSCGAQKIFFSTEEDFVTQGPEPPDGNPIISDGDLLCSDCTVFARNRELLVAFQTQLDLGLDAADVIDAEARKPLVAFSTVTDVLPVCLDYAGNVQTNINQNEPEVTNNKELKWFFKGPLNPCETITINYKARVVNCGKNENVQRVKAVCEKTGVEVYAEDRAIVIVPCDDIGESEKPDLVITQITGIGVVGEPLNIYYTIKNHGNAASGPSHTGLYINGNYIKKDPVSAFAPSASVIAKSFNYVWDCKNGEQAEIKVCADIATQVDESDEGNNCKRYTMIG